MAFVERDFIFKIILVGDERVGKTSLRRRFMGKSFKRNYIATMGADFSYTNVKVNDASIRYSIWDLAGSGAYEKIHPQYFMNTLGTIIVYDLTVPPSLINVNVWLRKVMEVNPHYDSVIAVVGNKSDLIPPEELEEKRKELANFVEQMRFKYEDKFKIIHGLTSALSGEGVKEIFEELGNSLLEWVDSQIVEETEVEEFIEEILFVTHSNSSRARIVSSSPFKDDDVIVNGKMKDINDLAKLFDFKTSMSHNNFFSITPWKSNGGVAYTITRVLNEDKAKQDNEFSYITLVVKMTRAISKEEENYLSEQLSLLFDQVQRLVNTYRADFNATDFNPMIRYKSARVEISKLLEQTRNTITYRLEYNI